MKIIVWNEARWDRKPPHVQEMARAQYPDGIKLRSWRACSPCSPSQSRSRTNC